ncbi:hypothetical protein CVT25_010655 [Psilocybe cyanescens]|uniref:GOLD domain-containing protein n=1 Tax=Psilocybe cyanescens TaxID=93625 RepID=A0A409WJW9_PSICY|nr:hypothetical protein CVT25_010655 [Psilocybe cyanescens]
MLRSIGLYLFLLASFLHASFAYTFRVQTNSLAPGDTFLYDVIVDNGDVEVVDLLLVNTQRGNTTTMLDNYTMKTGTNLGFTVPSVPAGTYMIRLVQASNKQFILDSTQFQITGISLITGSPSSSPSPSSGSSTPTDDVGNRNTSNNGKKSSTNVGAIAGGVVGGLVALGAVVLSLLCWRRSSQRNGQIQDLENEKLGPSGLTTPISPGGPATEIVPFTIAHRPTLPPLEGQSSVTVGSSSLPSKITREYIQPPATVTSSSTAAFPTSDTSGTNTSAISRAEHLRRERERINHEIAQLEQSASAGGTSTSPSSGSILSSSGLSSLRPSDSVSNTYTRDREISAQLSTLQEQIRQIEARQAYVGAAAGAEDDFSVPPPVYDGPSAPTSNAATVPVPVTFPVPHVMEAPAEASEAGRRVLPDPTTYPADVKMPVP